MSTREMPQAAEVARLAPAGGTEASPPDGSGWTVRDDEELLAGIRQRQSQALSEAFRRHRATVAAAAARVLYGLAVVDDVVQDVFLGLWSHPERYDPRRGSLGGYLRMQAVGRSVDTARSESRRQARQTEWFGTSEDLVEDQEAVVARLSFEKLRDALGKLPMDERVVIELAFFGGHTYAEVAARLHQPPGTVKSRIRRGMARLRSALEDEGCNDWV